MPRIKAKKEKIKKPREKKFDRQIRVGLTLVAMCIATLYYLNILQIVSGVDQNKIGGIFIINTVWITLFIYWWNHIHKKK